MKQRQQGMAPSAWCPLNGTGVRRIPRRKIQQIIKIGTWNVRSLKSPEKVHNLCKEIKRLNVDIMGLSDVRWKNNGLERIDEDHVLYYSGSNESSNKHGVGVIINTRQVNASINVVPISNRAMMLQLKTKPRNINIIQLYAPTTDGSDLDMENFYKEADQLLDITLKHEINIVMGDMNAKVGQGEVRGVVGTYGLGQRNQRGDTLVQFCQERDLVIMNTMFQHPARRLYTWTSPRHTTGHIMRNQIDFILINNRFKNCIKSAKTYPGTDIRSDHNPVVASLSCSLKRVGKKSLNKKVDIRKLNLPDIRPKVHTGINEWAMETKERLSYSVEENWHRLKSKLHCLHEDHLRPEKWKSKHDWMTKQIFDLMEERRLYKHINSPKYEEVDKKIRREVRFARTSWFNQKCNNIEELSAKHDAFHMYKEIKLLIGRKTTPQHHLVDENDLPVLDITKKCHLWEQYITNLFADDLRNPTVLKEIVVEGLPILKDEVRKALSKAKTGKAAGPDNVYIEILKLIEEENLDPLVHLMNTIYDTGQIPLDWLRSTFITLPKKRNAKKCEDFRTVSLMSQVLKLFLSVIHERIKTKCDEQLSDNQFGFRSGMGTREALFSVQVLVQKCKDMQPDIYMCFIDYEKAFDKVMHDRLITLLKDIGLDDRDIRIIQNLYWNQKATILVDGELSRDVDIRKGVRQGCILSPTLFNLYSEAIMAEALEDIDYGVRINGRIINNLRYADDTVLLAGSESELQIIVDRVNGCSEEAGLKMNITKTKIMIVSKNTNLDPIIRVSGQRLDRVNKYKYLGTWLTENWDCDTEIKSRIEIARSAFTSMKKVLTSRSLKISLRTRLLQCYVWPMLLYGCESWTVKEELRKRIEAFEMWAYRRMLRISWTQKVTNEEVLRRIGKERGLWDTIRRRKVAYLGHVLRHGRYSLLQLIMMGKVAGKRHVGRRKKSWLRNLREWTGVASAAQLFRLAKDRKKYAELIANLR